MKILIASNNSKKLVEIKRYLTDFDVVNPADIELELDVVEDGKTFEENAIKKVKAFSKKSRIISLADDSGLEVDFYLGPCKEFASGARNLKNNFSGETLKMSPPFLYKNCKNR